MLLLGQNMDAPGWGERFILLYTRTLALASFLRFCLPCSAQWLCTRSEIRRQGTALVLARYHRDPAPACRHVAFTR